jgi:hypothetical protein
LHVTGLFMLITSRSTLADCSKARASQSGRHCWGYQDLMQGWS